MQKEYMMGIQNGKPATVYYIIPDTCICCGAYVPEGDWVCPQCQRSELENRKGEVELL